MTKLYLIRHGQAAAGWGADADPGLDATGVAQSKRMAARMAPLGPMPVMVSPMRRTRETAVPLLEHWQSKPLVEMSVSEIPSPPSHVKDRVGWLRDVMERRWPQLDPDLRQWREAVLACLQSVRKDTTVISHFVAINVAVGAATDDDRVVCFRPQNCSRTVLEVADGALQLVELGEQAGETRVL